MAPDEQETVEELVESTRTGHVSRRAFIAAVTAAGATAGGAGILLAATRPAPAAPTAAPAPSDAAQEQTNIDLHNQHLERQAARPTDGTVDSATPGPTSMSDGAAAHLDQIVADYHHDAVVLDVMHPQPIVGKELIYSRKQAEMMNIANPKINITNRFAYGDQVVAEWEVTGTHVGDYLGYTATGNDFKIHGITVVTRREGKIAQESLYYDVRELAQQLGGDARAV
jgi:steroid delta-isomerase-like uncharacterized protein